jgi:hypothetical protein
MSVDTRSVAVPAVVLVELIVQAIARFEGFFNPVKNGKQNVSQRNNNPGNLRAWVGYPTVEGYANFPSIVLGWRCLRVQIWRDIVARRLTLAECIRKYAPAADQNDPDHYARTVEAWLYQQGIVLGSIHNNLVGWWARKTVSDSLDSDTDYPGLGYLLPE